MELLKVNELSKFFKNRVAVHQLSFELYKGESLCLLGPNGAGKSTTIHMIGGVLSCSDNRIFYEGVSITKCKQHFLHDIGFVPQDISLYEDLTAEQSIHFFASLYGLRGSLLKTRIEEALAFAELQDRRKDKVKTFSGGMKRRLNIVCAIAHHPKIVIMDEPTVGIDPQSRNHILASIKKLRDQGMTVLYMTHYMEEVEEISTRIIIMDHGDIIAEGTKKELKERMQAQRYYILEVENMNHFIEDGFYGIEGIQKVEIKEENIQITSLQNVENVEDIIGMVMK